MKPIFLSILFTTSLSFAQTAGKEDYKNTLKGPVSSIRIVTYKALDKGGGNYDKGEVEKGMENLLISYDKKGNMIEKSPIILMEVYGGQLITNMRGVM